MLFKIFPPADQNLYNAVFYLSGSRIDDKSLPITEGYLSTTKYNVKLIGDVTISGGQITFGTNGGCILIDGSHDFDFYQHSITISISRSTQQNGILIEYYLNNNNYWRLLSNPTLQIYKNGSSIYNSSTLSNVKVDLPMFNPKIAKLIIGGHLNPDGTISNQFHGTVTYIKIQKTPL